MEHKPAKNREVIYKCWGKIDLVDAKVWYNTRMEVSDGKEYREEVYT